MLNTIHVLHNNQIYFTKYCTAAVDILGGLFIPDNLLGCFFTNGFLLMNSVLCVIFCFLGSA